MTEVFDKCGSKLRETAHHGGRVRFGSRQKSVSCMSLLLDKLQDGGTRRKHPTSGWLLRDLSSFSIISEGLDVGKRLEGLCVHYDSNATLLKGDYDSWLHFCCVGHCLGLWSFTKSFIVPATANTMPQQTFSSPLSRALFSFLEAGEKEKCGATETLYTLFMKRASVPPYPSLTKH